MTTKPPRKAAGFPAMLGAARAVAPRAMLRPQRPLREAAADARQRGTPAGVGLDSVTVRARMVQRLRSAGLHCEPVCAALLHVPRHEFVDAALANQAYEDTSLPIGWQQTISKPSVVARMLALLLEGDGARQRGHLGRVLEIGTGCGYQTALLCLLAKHVVSIERIAGLHDKAQVNLGHAMPGSLRGPLQLVHGDGRDGHARAAPFDTIVAAAGGDDVPQAWLDQLAEGGRLVAPLSGRLSGAGRAGQALCIVDRRGGQWHRALHEAVHFVPLKSGIE